jgi:hypothetical protein
MGFFPLCSYCYFESPESPPKEPTNTAVASSQNDLIASDAVSERLPIVINIKIKSAAV